MKLENYRIKEALLGGEWATVILLMRNYFALDIGVIPVNILRPIAFPGLFQVRIDIPLSLKSFFWDTEEGFFQEPDIPGEVCSARATIWSPIASPLELEVDIRGL